MRRRSFTLIELLVFMFWVACAIFGAVKGAEFARDAGLLWQAGGMILGGVVGAVGGIAALIALLVPSIIYGAIQRAREPGELVCRCHEPGLNVPEKLLPHTPLEHQAIQESRRWSEWPELLELQLHRAPQEVDLRTRLAAGSLTEQQVALAAALGDPAAAAIGVPTAKPLVDYDHWVKSTPDLQLVLRSGLPPRMCMFWALRCAGRALEVFEREFHQDTRPRQRFGLALMALQEQQLQDAHVALVEWKRGGWQSGRPNERGCRVLSRTRWQRIRGQQSPGEYASDAVFGFASAAIEFIEPQRMWQVYPPGDRANAYETPWDRSVWSLPSHGAERVAYEARLAADSREEECARQRSDLARMILAWPRWHEDREAWRTRLENEWIPKIEQNAAGLPFNVPKYIEQLRAFHTPWSNRRAQ